MVTSSTVAGCGVMNKLIFTWYDLWKKWLKLRNCRTCNASQASGDSSQFASCPITAIFVLCNTSLIQLCEFILGTFHTWLLEKQMINLFCEGLMYNRLKDAECAYKDGERGLEIGWSGEKLLGGQNPRRTSVPFNHILLMIHSSSI